MTIDDLAAIIRRIEDTLAQLGHAAVPSPELSEQAQQIRRASRELADEARRLRAVPAVRETRR